MDGTLTQEQFIQLRNSSPEVIRAALLKLARHRQAHKATSGTQPLAAGMQHAAHEALTLPPPGQSRTLAPLMEYNNANQPALHTGVTTSTWSPMLTDASKTASIVCPIASESIYGRVNTLSDWTSTNTEVGKSSPLPSAFESVPDVRLRSPEDTDRVAISLGLVMAYDTELGYKHPEVQAPKLHTLPSPHPSIPDHLIIQSPTAATSSSFIPTSSSSASPKATQSQSPKLAIPEPAVSSLASRVVSSPKPRIQTGEKRKRKDAGAKGSDDGAKVEGPLKPAKTLKVAKTSKADKASTPTVVKPIGEASVNSTAKPKRVYRKRKVREFLPVVADAQERSSALTKEERHLVNKCDKKHRDELNTTVSHSILIRADI